MSNTSNTNNTTTLIISENDNPEFVGQLIDLFEDFLEARDIQIENDEKDDPNLDEDSTAIIYGSDYGELQTGIENILHAWDVSKLTP